MIGRLGGYNTMNLQVCSWRPILMNVCLELPASNSTGQHFHAVVIMWVQAMYVGSETISYMKYDHDQSESAFQATFHDMGSVEHKGEWCRCW